jgi:hypothetical protein
MEIAMPRTADFIRLRVPVSDDVYEMLKNRPLLLKGAQLAQPALIPGHELPLRVAVWPDEPDFLRDATRRAIDNWNDAMAKHTSISGMMFEYVEDITDGRIDLVVGTKPFEIPFDPVAEFGEVGGGMLFNNHTFGSPFGTPNAELGEIENCWNERYEVYVGFLAGRIYAPDDIKHRRTLVGIIGHELGHGGLLGHSPDTPSHIMYRHHTDVTKPKKQECLWAADIWL